MARRWRGGLVGCGFFAANHLFAWRDLPDAEIVAVCDRDAERARATRSRFGIASAYADAAEMLARERLDFIDIVTMVDSHRALVTLGAAHRVHVICQKPLALSMDDARAMVAATADAGVMLLVHENFRWQAPMRALREALDDGAIGRPSFARISFRHGFDIYRNQPYLATDSRLALVDVGVHVLDLARFFFGEATRVYCRNRRLNPRIVGEDSSTMLLDHENGAVSVVEISFFSQLDPDPFPQTLVHLEGHAGTLALTEGYRLTHVRNGRRQTRDVEPATPEWGEKPWHAVQDSVRSIQAHWLDCLRGHAAPQPSGADNLRTLDLVFKAYESAELGASIAVAHAITDHQERIQ